MPSVIKTLPTSFARGEIDRFLGCFSNYYFTLGRGRPHRCDVLEIWFTHRGQILGHFEIDEIVRNLGQLPRLTSMDGADSEWQIRFGNWVAVCRPPFHQLEERIYYSAFRGWRYFDLEKHRGTLDAKVRL